MVAHYAIKSCVDRVGHQTVSHPPYSPDLVPQAVGDLRGSRFEDIEKMKEAVTRVLDTIMLDDFSVAFMMWLVHHKYLEVSRSNFQRD